METKRLEVTAEGKKVYDIVIENNFNQLVKELSVFGIKERKLCIVTERQVASYYLEEVCSLLEKECAKLEVYIFQEGELRCWIERELESSGQLLSNSSHFRQCTHR